MRRLALAAILLWTPAMAAEPYITATSLGLMMREQVLKCWKSNPGAHRQMFIVDFRLNKDGSLAGTPSLHPGSPSLPPKEVAAAINAVERCAPYRLPAAYYDRWKSQEMTFFAGFASR
jgi:colicin import membrane protein